MTTEPSDEIVENESALADKIIEALLACEWTDGAFLHDHEWALIIDALHRGALTAVLPDMIGAGEQENDTTWFWKVVDANGLGNVSSDEETALRELVRKAEAYDATTSAPQPVAGVSDEVRGTFLNRRKSMNDQYNMAETTHEYMQVLHVACDLATDAVAAILSTPTPPPQPAPLVLTEEEKDRIAVVRGFNDALPGRNILVSSECIALLLRCADEIIKRGEG